MSCTQPTSYNGHPLVPLGPRVLSVCRQYSVEKIFSQMKSSSPFTLLDLQGLVLGSQTETLLRRLFSPEGTQLIRRSTRSSIYIFRREPWGRAIAKQRGGRADLLRGSRRRPQTTGPRLTTTLWVVWQGRGVQCWESSDANGGRHETQAEKKTQDSSLSVFSWWMFPCFSCIWFFDI